MKRLMTRMMILALAVVSVGFTLSNESQAGLLPVNVTITKDTSNYRYSYGVVLTSDSTLKNGDFFTIYDFQGLQAGTNTQPDGFTFSSATVGPTPGGTIPSDNASLDNVTWTYNGPDTVVGQTGLGNFMVQSQYGVTTEGVFTSMTHRQVDGQTDANITETEVPVPVGPSVPEPTTLALVGIGLPLAGFMRYLRRKS